jgi:hypothetical protein
MEEFKKDEYGYWSSIARVYHLPYKMYSVGKPIKSLLDHNNMVYNIEIMNEYFYCIGTDTDTQNTLRNKLAWLEHRRWNAFMRTKGFIAPTKEQFEHYAYKTDDMDHKNLELKLHPFILECSRFSEKYQMIDEKDWSNNENFEKDPKLDDVDKAMIERYKKALNGNNKKKKEKIEEDKEVKQWDLPEEDKKIMEVLIKRLIDKNTWGNNDNYKKDPNLDDTVKTIIKEYKVKLNEKDAECTYPIQ